MTNLFLKGKKDLHTRFPFVYLIIVALFGILIINLINLQIVRGNENLFLSSTLKTSEVVVRAPRGLIYDREGNLLVVNRPSFKLILDLTLLPKESEEETISLLAEILEVDYDKLQGDFRSRVYGEGTERTAISQITLLNDVDRDKIVSIYSRSEELPAVFVEVGTTREYIDSSALAHVIGYVREVSAEELESESNYSIGDMIGSIGIEQYYDSTLRGVNGKRIVETDRDEVQVRELMPIEAESGRSVRISIDTSMQKKMTEVLGAGIERENADGGAAIIMDVHTGEIVTLVSLPSFDSNEIVKGLTYSQYLELSNDARLPLYNRAISMTQPPGSTLKTIIGAVGLEEGVITPSTLIESEGCMDLGAGYEFCEVGKVAFGQINIYKAYERSSNIYFAKTLMKYGIDKLNEYTDDFGLGQKTGIDLIGEQPGIMASKETKQNMQCEPWYLGDTANTAIGQSITRVSPLQMVSWIASIANDGKYYKPHLAMAVVDENGEDIEVFEPEIIHEVPISGNNLTIVKEGMHQAVNGSWGSAWPLRGLKSDPAAKTGSAEAWRKVGDIYETQGHSWITGFYPYKDPQYAFVVYLEFGGWGYKSAEVMRDFLLWYDGEYN
ncbi:penicillin-binding protein 2 [Candidatus Dojkabacteria bacterium]|nr:penicillin-binding protein 2 [Candidatus Dojkabacteria bacterium]